MPRLRFGAQDQALPACHVPRRLGGLRTPQKGPVRQHLLLVYYYYIAVSLRDLKSIVKVLRYIIASYGFLSILACYTGYTTCTDTPTDTAGQGLYKSDYVYL